MPLLPRNTLSIVTLVALGLSGCIPTPVPRSYEHGPLVPEYSSKVVDATSGQPISNARVTIQYSRCIVEEFMEPAAWNSEADVRTRMTSRVNMPEAWLNADQRVALEETTDTDAAGGVHFDAHDRFTFFVIPLIPNAPVGSFYDRYLAPYRLLIEHPDYGTQRVMPQDEVKLKKATSR